MDRVISNFEFIRKQTPPLSSNAQTQYSSTLTDIARLLQGGIVEEGGHDRGEVFLLRVVLGAVRQVVLVDGEWVEEMLLSIQRGPRMGRGGGPCRALGTFQHVYARQKHTRHG